MTASSEPGALGVRHVFTLDGRRAAPVRPDWYTAAQDAVAMGYGTWAGPSEIHLDASQGAAIERVG